MYNAQAYKNQNNQEFYPTGSVWRGIENTEKPPTPNASSNSCGFGHGKDGFSTAKNEGPNKRNSCFGDVQPPKIFNLFGIIKWMLGMSKQ